MKNHPRIKNRLSTIRLRAIMLMTIVLLTFAAQPQVACAQWGDDDPMSMMKSPIQARDVELLTRFLRLDEDQTLIIGSLQDDYESRWRESMSAFFDSMQDFSEEMGFEEGEIPIMDMEDTERMDRWQEMAKDMQKREKKRRETLKAMRESFFNDVRLLLTDEQSAYWPIYERERRRRSSLKAGAQFSGESADLIEILESIELTETEIAQITWPSEIYANELDTLLKVRNDMARAMQEAMLKMMDGDMMEEADEDALAGVETWMSKLGDIVDRRREIAEVNRRHGPILSAYLGSENRREFDRQFHQACFPRVYVETEADQYLEKVRELDGLSVEQVGLVDNLAFQYESRVSPLNRSLSDVQLRIEENLKKQLKDSSNPMINSMVGGMSMYDEDAVYESPFTAADLFTDDDIEEKRVRIYDEKRQVVRTTVEQLHAILTPDQQESTPAPNVPDTDSNEASRRQMREMFSNIMEQMSDMMDSAFEEMEFDFEGMEDEDFDWEEDWPEEDDR